MWKITITITVLVALGLTLYLPLSSPQGIFNTPDENANYFFAEKFSFNNGLRIFEPLADKVDNAIHPRGVNVIKDFLVPESFLGMPILYGTLLELIKKAWIPLVFASVLTIFAIYALYQLFLHFFERRTARLSLLLVLTLPVFIYWAGRPYMHTILFLDFLILGWWMMARVSNRWDVVAGIFLGLALAMRTSEVVWVGIGTILLVFGLGLGGQFGPRIKKLVIRTFKVSFGAALIVIFLLFINKDLYGNFFGTGYSVSETNLIVEGDEIPQLARVSFAEQLLLPFGFHPLPAFGRFVRYAFGGMWWYVAPMVLGGIVGIRNQESGIRNRRRYLAAWGVLSLYLVVVYGSFRAEIFADPMHPLTATIGAPYLRYWLPIFVFGAPFVAEFLIFIRDRIMNQESRIKDRIGYVLRSASYVLGVVFIVFLSLRTVIWHGLESWVAIKENLLQFSGARERAEQATPEGAVFIVPRWADRIVWPSRQVIVDVEGKDVVNIIKTLHGESVPVFWHRGRGEIKLEPEIYDAGFNLERRFDIDPKGKIYEIRN